MQQIAVAQLHPNPRQPRTHFNEEPLEELAASIRENGILQPILVRPRGAGGFEIVAGERRYRAALRAGLTQIPAIVRDLSDQETLALALIENLLREDISPLETARSFRRLIDDFGWTQEELSRRVGKSRSAVANALRLLELPLPLQESLERREITEGHARVLIGDARGRDPREFREKQQQLWNLIREKNLTVREAERFMRTQKTSGSAPKATDSSRSGVSPSGQTEARAIEDRIRAALGTRVRLIGSLEKGKLELDYYSGDELDRLLTIFGATSSS